MGSLREAFETIAAQARKLSATQRLLIGSLGVIMLMTLFLLSQYAAKPTMVELLPGAAAETQAEAVAFLSTSGFDYQDGAGEVMVRPNDRRAIVARMQQDGRMPGDTSMLFEGIIERQSWTNPKELNEQLYNMALQNELARTLGEFRGVRSASVMIDAPPPHGLGMATRVPTASVTVTTESGGAMGQGLVDAVARFVAGAKAGLRPERVSVIDASTGLPRRVRSDDDTVSSSYLEHAQKVESQTRDKLAGLLSYIPGVIVAVTAEVDVTRRTTQTLKQLKNNEGSVSLIKSEMTKELEQRTADRGARPGVQANTGADLDVGASDSPALTDADSTTEFENRFGTESTSVVDPRGMPTRVAVSVNVPSGYIAELIRAEAGPDAAEGEEPTAETINARFEAERSRIAASLEPHLPREVAETGDGPATERVLGSVVVSLMPGATLAAAQASPGGLGGLGGALSVFGGGGGGSPISAGLDTIALGLLAVVAVAMMLMTVKQANKRPELPAADDLSGVPKQLQVDSDLVGEASEGDSPMAGIELDDQAVQGQQLFEQIGNLVDADPEFASRLLRRWIQPD
ncbi:MAG: hypothetical protein AAF108_02235 [Planctomycetota bacterium]